MASWNQEEFRESLLRRGHTRKRILCQNGTNFESDNILSLARIIKYHKISAFYLLVPINF